MHFLQEIWPKVRGIGFAVPKERKGDIPQAEIDHILLTNNENLVATGSKAFETLGVSLDQKRFLTAGHQYP